MSCASLPRSAAANDPQQIRSPQPDAQRSRRRLAFNHQERLTACGVDQPFQDASAFGSLQAIATLARVASQPAAASITTTRSCPLGLVRLRPLRALYTSCSRYPGCTARYIQLRRCLVCLYVPAATRQLGWLACACRQSISCVLRPMSIAHARDRFRPRCFPNSRIRMQVGTTAAISMSTEAARVSLRGIFSTIAVVDPGPYICFNEYGRWDL